MQIIDTKGRSDFFKVLLNSSSAQAAIMTLRPRQSTGANVENENPKAEQWLSVIRGSAYALVGKKRVVLSKGSLLLIETNEPHQVACTGRAAMATLTHYVPPDYGSAG